MILSRDETIILQVVKALFQQRHIFELRLAPADFAALRDALKETEVPYLVRFLDRTGRFVRANVSETAFLCEEAFYVPDGVLHEFYFIKNGGLRPAFLVINYRQNDNVGLIFPE